MKKVKLKINLFICLCIIITSIFYKSDIINASTTNFETLLEQQEYVTNPENIKNDLGNDVYQEMLAQIPALEAYTQLYNSFRNENGDIVYPEGYAGEYIEGDTLFVCTNSIDTSFIDGFSNIKIKKVNYSIKELIAFANEIKIDNPNHEMEGYTISPKDNSLYVYIKKSDIAFAKKEFNNLKNTKRINNDVNVNFVETEITIGCATSLYGGIKITNSAGSGFTLGFCGTYNGKNAILTCGHDQSTTYTLRYTGIDIGKFVEVQYDNNEYGDYSVAEITNTGYTISNDVTSGSAFYNVTGTTLFAPVGTILYRYGQKSGLEALLVQTLDVNVSPKTGLTIKGMTRCSHYSGNACIDGDSGGPVYSLMYNNECSAVGIIHGINSSGNVYYTPMGYISSSFTTKYN